MIPFVAAGRVGVSMLRTLYKGKKKIGKMTGRGDRGVEPVQKGGYRKG